MKSIKKKCPRCKELVDTLTDVDEIIGRFEVQTTRVCPPCAEAIQKENKQFNN